MKNRMAAAFLGALMSWAGWQILGAALEHGPSIGATMGRGPIVSWEQPVGLSMLALGLMIVLAAWNAEEF